ncbi:unnamed protein product [Cyclocybe aegerita]|uniref:Glucosidase 2 subunit beta n=1 Tax=Cyclocybe aegerita TaxID=1973307 RepID=A0A8S0W3R3_CYCAE|nr:unnamed protein product [Cyclocybe aegerita]
MIPWAILLCTIPLAVTAGPAKPLGVAPELASKYVPSKAGTWKCLDGSKEIPWNFVNDDSCDCPDESDEPGTSACPNSKFYCNNEGHTGTYIPSSRVNDGLCEPQCCDGSDEPAGLCPNQCKEVGEAYRKKYDAEMKLRKTGSKIRATYIVFAHKEKKRLEAEVVSLEKEIEEKEKEVERLQDVADRAESISQAALDHRKESPLYKSLIKHHNALKSLQREYKKKQEREKALGQILSTLRTSYNPNYQDMGVLEAVRGWEELAGLPHINDVDKGDKEGEGQTEEAKEEAKEEEKLEEGMLTAEELESSVDPLLNTDYVSLLLEHDEHVQTPIEDSLLFDLQGYLPDSAIPVYEDIKDTLVSWLQKLGIIRSDDSAAAADSTRARQAFHDAERALGQLKSDKSNKEKDANEIFSIEGFGAEGEWKKLDGTCIEKDEGEYIYEVCFFQEVKQKPKNGGSTFSLGKFDSWNPSVEVGTPGFYEKQVYNRGTRCWNGPERNTKLVLSCGLDNAIQTVLELEKCEYQITATSPALCLPVNEKTKGSRDEL